MFVKQKFCFFVNNNETYLQLNYEESFPIPRYFLFKKATDLSVFVTITGQNIQHL